MSFYGTQLKWSTSAAPNAVGGTTENFDITYEGDDTDYEGGDGKFEALVLANRRGNISFESQIKSTSIIPILGDDGACAVSFEEITGGGVLFSDITESWGVNEGRKLTGAAVHYPDLPSLGGGSVSNGTPDAMAASPLIVPNGAVAWDTGGVVSALGLVQRFSIQQSVKHSTYSEGGKIVGVKASMHQIRMRLEVLAKSATAVPARGAALALTSAPARFKTGSAITSVGERYRKGDGVLYTIEARWSAAWS